MVSAAAPPQQRALMAIAAAIHLHFTHVSQLARSKSSGEACIGAVCVQFGPVRAHDLDWTPSGHHNHRH